MKLKASGAKMVCDSNTPNEIDDNFVIKQKIIMNLMNFTIILDTLIPMNLNIKTFRKLDLDCTSQHIQILPN